MPNGMRTKSGVRAGGVAGALSALLASLMVVLGVGVATAAAQPGGDDDRVTVTAHVQRPVAVPGDRFAVAVRFEFAEAMHIWPNDPVLPPELKGLVPIPTTIEVGKGAGAGAGAGGEGAPALPAGVKVYTTLTAWPAAEDVEVAFLGDPVVIKSYKKRTHVYVPVVVLNDAPPGKVTIPFDVRYQACNDTMCFPPETVRVEATFEIAPVGTMTTPAFDSATFDGFDPSVFSRIDAGDVPAAAAKVRQFDFLGYTFGVAENAYVLILGIAFLAGLLMNFTPCVLPVVPIKVLSIQSHAKSPGKLVWYGTVYCIGIVAMYAVLGLLAFGVITGGQKYDWGQIFTHAWFVIGMSVIVAVMGVGMMGWFTIRLPNFVYAVNPTGESATGNFVGGVLTGILAVPCTGPLLGATLAWILTQPPAVGIGVFVLMGVGMASPYALLICFPKLLNKVPRGGPGSELLKQVMGLFMLAVAAFLAGNLVREKWPWYVVGLLSVLAFGWLVAQGRRMLKTGAGKNWATAIGVIGIVTSIWVTVSLTRPPPVEWRVFVNQPDAELMAAIEQERAAGRVVVVDFTAKWCTNCHVIEKTIIYAQESLAALKAADVVEFKVDLTDSTGEQGWGTVRAISGGGGIPLIAVFGPGIDKPVYFQSFFKPSDLVAAIEKARGVGGVGGAGGAGAGAGKTAAAVE